MNPVVLANIGSVVRMGLAGAGTILVSKGIVTADAWTGIVTNGTAAVGSAILAGTAIWAAYKNWKAHRG